MPAVCSTSLCACCDVARKHMWGASHSRLETLLNSPVLQGWQQSSDTMKLALAASETGLLHTPCCQAEAAADAAQPQLRQSSSASPRMPPQRGG